MAEGLVSAIAACRTCGTKPLETDAHAMRAALSAHDEVLREAIEREGGFLFSTTAAMATDAYGQVDQDRADLNAVSNLTSFESLKSHSQM